jgi:hypothetical protein
MPEAFLSLDNPGAVSSDVPWGGSKISLVGGLVAWVKWRP